MEISKPEGAELRIKFNSADEFKKAIVEVLLDEKITPLINIWYNEDTDKLNYSIGSAVGLANDYNQKRLLDVIGSVLKEIGKNVKNNK